MCGSCLSLHRASWSRTRSVHRLMFGCGFGRFVTGMMMALFESQEKFSQMTEQPPAVILSTRDNITRWTHTLKQVSFALVLTQVS